MKHCLRDKNIFEFVGKHFCFLGSKFIFRKKVFEGGQTGKNALIDGKHNVSAFCSGLKMMQAVLNELLRDPTVHALYCCLI